MLLPYLSIKYLSFNYLICNNGKCNIIFLKNISFFLVGECHFVNKAISYLKIYVFA